MQQELEIEDLVIGTGKAAERGALITAHYVGWLEDGTEFDSSYKKNIPFQTVLSNKRVIQGWILGLQDMQVGGKRRLRVPAHLAYAERQIGTMIPPHSNLLFEIELLEVLTREADSSLKCITSKQL
jgi:peptidylprolyl isomerase